MEYVVKLGRAYFTVMLSVLLLSVLVLNVNVLNVLVPKKSMRVKKSTH